MGCLQPPHGPEQLYTRFTVQAETANDDIRDFIKLLKDDRTKNAFEQVKSSRGRDGENIKAWRFSEHANWLTIPKRFEGALGIDAATDTDPIDLDEANEDDITEIVQRFKDQHPEIAISSDEARKTVKLMLPAPAELEFQIEQKPGNIPKTSYEIWTESPKPLNRSIVSAVNSRSKHARLERLLVCSLGSITS